MRYWLIVPAAVVAGGGALLYAGVSKPEKAQSSIRHHIVKGDTLGDLAARYGTTTKRLRQMNAIDGETIFIGEMLEVKPAKRWWRNASASGLRGLTGAVDGFDFPVGKGEATRYYNAQPFGENDHLGDDWNGVGGGNTDLGDPVLASATGIVVSARDVGRGWGNVVRIVHNAGSADAPMFVETVYAHLDEIHVKARQRVARREKIGTIGTAGGRYPAHLHFEVRTTLDGSLGRGYSKKTKGYADPSAFVRKNRP